MPVDRHFLRYDVFDLDALGANDEHMHGRLRIVSLSTERYWVL